MELYLLNELIYSVRNDLNFGMPTLFELVFFLTSIEISVHLFNPGCELTDKQCYNVFVYIFFCSPLILKS